MLTGPSRCRRAGGRRLAIDETDVPLRAPYLSRHILAVSLRPSRTLSCGRTPRGSAACFLHRGELTELVDQRCSRPVVFAGRDPAWTWRTSPRVFAFPDRRLRSAQASGLQLLQCYCGHWLRTILGRPAALAQTKIQRHIACVYSQEVHCRKHQGILFRGIYPRC